MLNFFTNGLLVFRLKHVKVAIKKTEINTLEIINACKLLTTSSTFLFLQRVEKKTSVDKLFVYLVGIKYFPRGKRE